MSVKSTSFPMELWEKPKADQNKLKEIWDTIL